MVIFKRWLLNLRPDKKTANIYKKHKGTVLKVRELVLIGERPLDTSRPASLLKNLPSHPLLAQNKERKNLIWGYSNSEKIVYREQIHNSTQEQALRKGHNPTAGRKSPKVAQDSIIARIRYLFSMCIPCNLQEWVLVDQLAYQLRVAKKDRLNSVDKSIKVVKS